MPGGGRVCGDDLPSPPAARAQAREAATYPGPGAVAGRARAGARGAALERFVDISPEETYATLLDEGTYLCSPRTMYRILEAKHGGVCERRNQLTHPPYEKPALLAERPNELWSWDISKLKGPAKWTWFYLYVILDVFSRFAARRKTAVLFPDPLCGRG